MRHSAAIFTIVLQQDGQYNVQARLLEDGAPQSETRGYKTGPLPTLEAARAKIPEGFLPIWPIPTEGLGVVEIWVGSTSPVPRPSAN
jgi:hypothetical protein